MFTAGTKRARVCEFDDEASLSCALTFEPSKIEVKKEKRLAWAVFDEDNVGIVMAIAKVKSQIARRLV
jgi:hypothetical protein